MSPASRHARDCRSQHETAVGVDRPLSISIHKRRGADCGALARGGHRPIRRVGPGRAGATARARCGPTSQRRRQRQIRGDLKKRKFTYAKDCRGWFRERSERAEAITGRVCDSVTGYEFKNAIEIYRISAPGRFLAHGITLPDRPPAFATDRDKMPFVRLRSEREGD